MNHFLTNFKRSISCGKSTESPKDEERGVDWSPILSLDGINSICENLILIVSRVARVTFGRFEKIIVLYFGDVGMCFVHSLIDKILLFFFHEDEIPAHMFSCLLVDKDIRTGQYWLPVVKHWVPERWIITHDINYIRTSNLNTIL